MSRRRLDLAAAQQRLTETIAPDDEVVAIARVTLGAAWRRSDRLGIFAAAAIAAAGWAVSPRPGPPSILFSLPLAGHLVSMATPRRRRRDADYFALAITHSHLLLCDYPIGTAPVRVIFASPASALQLKVRSSRRLTEIACSAAGGGQLILFGRRRRKFVLVVSSEDQAQRVCAEFVSRGGIGPPAVPYSADLAAPQAHGEIAGR